MKQFVGIIFFVCICISCKHKKRETSVTYKSLDLKEYAIPTDSLINPEHFSITSDSLNIPVRMILIDTVLTVEDFSEEPALHFIDTKSGTQIAQFGRRGEGPGEFEDAWNMGLIPNRENAFSVYDTKLLRLTVIKVKKKGMLKLHPSILKIIKLHSTKGLPYYPIFVSDSSIVASGLYTNNRLAFFGDKGKVYRYTGMTPPGPSNIPGTIKNQAYKGILRMKSDGTKMVLACHFGDRLEFYNKSGKLYKIVEGKIKPEYELQNVNGNPVMGLDSKTRLGYLDIKCTNNYIFVLFSGRKMHSGYEVANTIRVFDWNGKLVKVMKLNENIECIAINDKKNILYAINPMDKKPVLYWHITI